MKAFYIPAAVLAMILGFSLWAGQYVALCTGRWTALLEETDAAAMDEDWSGAAERLEQAYRDWDNSQTFLHTIMEHDQLDEAESLFFGAFAACREQDNEDFHIMLAQLIHQLRLLDEAQAISIKNVL